MGKAKKVLQQDKDYGAVYASAKAKGWKGTTNLKNKGSAQYKKGSPKKK